MRLLLGFAALVATVVTFTYANGYENGREYMYEYYGHLHTHMPKMEQQVSGVVFRCKLLVQPRKDYMIIKAMDMMFDKVHKDVEDFDEHVFNYRTIQELTEFMSKPFKIRYDHGKIRNIQITRGEPLWSINMKKSIASVFNMDLEAMNPIMPKEERFYGDMERGYGMGHELPTNYRVYEDGIYGECETMYDIQKTVWPEMPYMTVLNVTKVKNYEHCRNTPHIFFGVKHGYQCNDCPGDKSFPVTSNAAYHYNIKGTRHNFIIEKMMADGEIMFTPYTPNGNIIRILLNRTMTLMEIRDVRSDITMPGDIITYNKLSYMFTDMNEGGRMIDLKHAHQLVAAYGLRGNVDEVGRLFRNMVDFDYKDNEIKHAIQKDSLPLKFLEIIYSFVLLDYQQIDDFYHRFVEPGSEEYKEVFADLLSVAGTNPAFMYSKYLIQSKKISEDESIEILRNMPFHIREPSEILFDEFYRLCEGSHVRDNHEIHSACLMAFSSMIYQTCVVKYHNTWNDAKENAICTPTMAAKYFNYLVPQYERNLEEKERIMYIKVAGNFGLKEALPFLEKYAEDKMDQFPVHIRMISIWVLEKAAFYNPEKVRDIVLPIYRNWTESHEIRLAAFTILMRTFPDMALLKSIAAELVTTEPNTQVISYVWSTFKHMAELDYPCYFEIARHLEYVMPIIEGHERLKDLEEWPYSKKIINGGYEPEFDYGGYSVFSYIMANDSYMPRSMYIRMNDYMNNFNYDTFSASFDSWGLEPILDKMFGPKVKGDISPGRSLWNFFGRRRSTRDIAVHKEVKEIDQNLHIETRNHPKPYAALRVTAFNNELINLNFDEEMFDTIMTSDKGPMSILRKIVGDIKDFQVRSFMMDGDMSMFLPTEIGLPFYLERKQPMFMYYKNKEMKFDVKGNEADGTIDEFTTKINGHFMYDHHTIETASILVPFEKISVGVGYDSRIAMSIPVDIDAGMNMVDRKFRMKTHPQSPHEIFHYDFKPFSFIESFENALPVIHEETKVDIFMEEDLHMFEREYFHDMFGMGIKMSGHFLETPDFWGTWKKFWYSNDFRQKLYYVTENPMWHPRKISMMMSPANRDITNEIEFNMGWSWLMPETRGNKIYTSKHSAQIGDESFSIRDEARSYTSVIDLEMILRGQRERKIVSEMAYTRTRDLMTHHLNFFYDRTPFTMGETDNMKICFHGSMKFPPIEHDKFTETDIPIDGTVGTNFLLNFGKDCKTDHKISMKGVFEHTEEQKHMIETREMEEPIGRFMKNPLRPLWRECMRHRRNGIGWNIHCDEYYFMASQLNRFIADIEYENLSKEFMWYMMNMRRYMRHMYFPWLADIEDMNIMNPEGKMHIIANVSTWEPVMDVRLMLTKENIHYKQAPVPMWFIPPRTYAFFEYTNLEEISSMYRHRVCDVQGPSIRTFDDVFFMLPDTNCFKVLAKDCSPNEHFMIMGATTRNPMYSKALRMFMDTFKIEMMPITDDGTPIVRVNGKKVPVTPEEPFRQFVNTGVRDIEVFNIMMYGSKPIYKIISDVFGIRIAYDGKGIYIQVAPMYRGKVCGLCGDYNLNKFREFMGPDMCLHYNSTSFGNSYVVPSGECTAPENRSPCTYPIGDTCTLMRTKTMEVGEGRNRQICFSIRPLPKCAESCIETRMMTTDMGFHCLPAKDSTTKDLLGQAAIRPLTMFRRKRQDREMTIQHPESCYRP
ncbi:vitellogenin-6 [Ixodes scapularis]|uniref:vitellogenin-6 n=1 Tax=Ixodes scapularis TaxID=6945 RepID=UPI001C386AB6|nr:vitellogenin-6 [Ixodes scapularis]